MTDSKTAALVQALGRLDERLAFMGGCTDGGCVIVKPKGMHTNGGCKCLNDRHEAYRLAHFHGEFVKEVRAALQQEPASGDAIKPHPDWNKPSITPREVDEMVLGLEKSVKAHGFQLMTGLKGELAIEPRPREGADPRLLVGDYFTHQRSGARFAVSAITSREAGSTIELVPAPLA